jgi:hypothetical protein
MEDHTGIGCRASISRFVVASMCQPSTSPIVSSWPGCRARHMAIVGPWSSTQRTASAKTDLTKRSRASFLSSSTAARYWGKRVPWNFGSTFRRSFARELGISGHSPAEETTTERAVAQDSQSGVLGIGQHVHIDLAPKEVIGRLHGIELGVGPEHTNIRICVGEKLLMPITRILPSRR